MSRAAYTDPVHGLSNADAASSFATLQGQVTSRHWPHSAVEGALVTTDVGPYGTTDQNGEYRIPNVPLGTTTVTASHADYWAAGYETIETRTVDVGGDMTVDFTDFAGKADAVASIHLDREDIAPGETIYATVTLGNSAYSVDPSNAWLDLSFDDRNVTVGVPTGDGWSALTPHPPGSSGLWGIRSDGSPYEMDTTTEYLISANRTGPFHPADTYAFSVPLTAKSDASGLITLKYRGTILDDRDPYSTGSAETYPVDQQGWNVRTLEIPIVYNVGIFVGDEQAGSGEWAAGAYVKIYDSEGTELLAEGVTDAPPSYRMQPDARLPEGTFRHEIFSHLSADGTQEYWGMGSLIIPGTASQTLPRSAPFVERLRILDTNGQDKTSPVCAGENLTIRVDVSSRDEAVASRQTRVTLYANPDRSLTDAVGSQSYDVPCGSEGTHAFAFGYPVPTDASVGDIYYVNPDVEGWYDGRYEYTDRDNWLWQFEVGACNTAPTIIDHSPMGTGVPVDVPADFIVAEFDADMDGATLNGSTFSLRSSKGSPVSGTVTYDAVDRLVSFDPAASLQYEMTYTATVEGGAEGVKTTGGVPMNADYTWTFATAARAPISAPTNLNASPISPEQIDLIWTDSSSDETAFHIERASDGTLNWVEIDTVPADTTVYSDNRVTLGTPYAYRVRAYREGDAQYSAYSNVAQAAIYLYALNDSPTRLGQTTTFTAILTDGGGQETRDVQEDEKTAAYRCDIGIPRLDLDADVLSSICDGFRDGTQSYDSAGDRSWRAETMTPGSAPGMAPNPPGVLHTSRYEAVSREALSAPTHTADRASITYDWSFGDATTANGAIVSHTYVSPGWYTAVVTASDGTAAITATTEVHIYEMVEANFSGTPTSGPAPLRVDFTNLSTGDFDTCIWDFGDGSTGTDCDAPSHTYAAPGAYTVTLTVSGSGGTDDRTLSDLISVERRCEPVGNARVLRFPAGELYAEQPVRFTAAADGTIPFTCTWKVNGEIVGDNRSTLDYAFPSPAIYLIDLQIQNTCGLVTQTREIEIHQSPGSEIPNLSRSYQTVSANHVESGARMTYTLFLKNVSPTAAAAALTDTLPIQTTYLPGSARASSGSVSVSGETLHWSGQVISGTPVVVELAVEVQGVPEGTPIENTAILDDGSGRITPLTTSSVYNPDYSLIIEEGARYTNNPVVDLRFSWNADDPITHVKISNDGGFGAGSENTDWLPVDPHHPTYANWTLSILGDPRLPRTVYAVYADLSGRQYGPIQDNITYDPLPPRIQSIEIVHPASQRAAGTGDDGAVVMRVTATDDNSGVDTFQFSDREDFATFSEFEVTGCTTDTPWTPPPTGITFLRAVDRALNRSMAHRVEIVRSYAVYLPLILIR